MDFRPSEMMMFQDNILTLKQLEGDQLHESWTRFKVILIQCPTHEIPGVVLLECCYTILCPVNRLLDDPLIPGSLVRKPYVIESQLFYHMTESN